MATLKKNEPNEAKGELKEIYNEIEKDVGRVPNIFQYLGNFPGSISAYFAIGKELEKGKLTAKQREMIALAVSQKNNCNYCLAAHTAIGKSVGLSPEVIKEAKSGNAEDGKNRAILSFVQAIVEKRGLVTAEEVQSLQAAGVDDQEIVEIHLTIVHTFFTNYFNHLNDTPVDF